MNQTPVSILFSSLSQWTTYLDSVSALVLEVDGPARTSDSVSRKKLREKIKSKVAKKKRAGFERTTRRTFYWVSGSPSCYTPNRNCPWPTDSPIGLQRHVRQYDMGSEVFTPPADVHPMCRKASGVPRSVEHLNYYSFRRVRLHAHPRRYCSVQERYFPALYIQHSNS